MSLGYLEHWTGKRKTDDDDMPFSKPPEKLLTNLEIIPYGTDI